jgi:putative tricarboxylic transport membrane protein
MTEVESGSHGAEVQEPSAGRAIAAELLVGLGVVLLGAVVIWQTTEIRLTPINSKVGPRVIPYIVGAGLVFTGIWFVIDVLVGRGTSLAEVEDQEDVDLRVPTDWATLALLGASLVAYLLLIERAGYVIASTALFVGAAIAMGSRRFVRDFVVGLALALVTFEVFTRGLSLRLPEGVLPLAGIW